MNRKSWKNLHDEIQILDNLKSPHIIKLVDKFKTKNHFYLILEYCNGGDLETYLEKKLVLTEEELRIIFQQVLLAMQEMQRIRAVHRDIKNANILLHFCDYPQDLSNKFYQKPLSQGRVKVKLADFGFSTILGINEQTKTQCGTPLNMAPEVLNGQYYNYKVDMWSLGVSMFEALLGTPPFFGKDRDELTDNINQGLIRLQTNLDISSSCIDFLSKLLHYDPEMRISIDHALNHPFINKQSPQYMEKIDMLRNNNRFTQSTNLQIRYSSQLDKGYKYLNIHEGKIGDETSHSKLKYIEQFFEMRKSSDDLRVGQYFDESMPGEECCEDHDIQENYNLFESLEFTQKKLKFHNIKTKSSKHLLEPKKQRSENESNLLKRILKPQDMITEESKEILEDDSSDDSSVKSSSDDQSSSHSSQSNIFEKDGNMICVERNYNSFHQQFWRQNLLPEQSSRSNINNCLLNNMLQVGSQQVPCDSNLLMLLEDSYIQADSEEDNIFPIQQLQFPYQQFNSLINQQVQQDLDLAHDSDFQDLDIPFQRGFLLRQETFQSHNISRDFNVSKNPFDNENKNCKSRILGTILE
eukprot:403339616